MTSIREVIRRMFGEHDQEERRPSPPRPEFSYRVFWTKMAREWSPERLRAVERAVQEVVAGEGFEPNEYERRYQLEALGAGGHSGASLLALLDVIDALQDYEDQEREERGS